MSTQTQSTLTGIRYKTDIEKWEARLSLQGKSHSKIFSTVDEAVVWRKSMQEPKAAELFLTCADLFSKWLECLKNDSDISQQTYMRYASDVKVHLLNFFGKYKIKELNDELVLKFTILLKELKREGKPLAAKTIKNIIGALSNFFEYCCIRNYITLNPAKSPLFRQNLARLVKERKRFDKSIKEKARTIDELQSLVVASYQRNFEFGLVLSL